MFNSFALPVLLLASFSASAKCVPYAATLADVDVLTCNSITIEADPAASRDSDAANPARLSGTLITGNLKSQLVVAPVGKNAGVIPKRPVYGDGRQYLLVQAPADEVCPSAFPKRLHFVAYPGGCMEGRRDPWSGRFPFKVVRVEPSPKNWQSVAISQ